MENTKNLLVAAVCVLTALSCGNCDEGGSNPSNGVADAGNNVSDSGPSDASNSGTADVSTGNDGGTSGDMGNADAGEGTICGAYASVCSGACIPTHADPDNCGGCGVVCGADEVCQGGQCITDCLPGQRACDRRCVDTDNDSEHCGDCGVACGAGEGCVAADCVTGIDVDFDAAACEDGGPPVNLGSAAPEDLECAADLAELTFRYGVCSCQDVLTNNEFDVDAYDSFAGPYVPGGLGGGVGVNGMFDSNNSVDITGALWVAGDVMFNNPASIGLFLLAGGNLEAGEGTVGRDAYVGGTMNVGDWQVADTLHLSPNEMPPASATYGTLVNEVIDVPAPCTACPPDNAIDIAGIVADGMATNDNAVIGLDPDVLSGTEGRQRLDLPCGRYYLDEIDTNEPVTIVAHGNTALFIGGDVTSNNPLTITVTEDAQLDLFIGGNLSTNNEFKLGSPNYPALLRVYVGGPEGISTNNQVTLAGFLYAVPGQFAANNQVEVYGGVYSNGVDTNNRWLIHYDRRITTIGDSCRSGGGGSGGGNNNTGMGGGGGGDNVCTTAGGMCEGNSDCCSPLTCQDGTCALLDCVPTNGACTDSSQCCRGGCSSAIDGICVVQ